MLIVGPDEGKVLFRRVKWDFQNDPLEDGQYYPIYERVRGLSLRYLDENGEWLEEWDAGEHMLDPALGGEEEEDPPGEEDEEMEIDKEPQVLPRAVEIVLYIYVGDERGLVRNEGEELMTERYSTVVPLLSAETLILVSDDLIPPDDGNQ